MPVRITALEEAHAGITGAIAMMDSQVRSLNILRNRENLKYFFFV